MYASTGLTWDFVQQATQGRLGRIVVVCPMCSEQRRAHNRRLKVLALTLVEQKLCLFYCNHCLQSGFVSDDKSSRPIDFAEQQRRREQAKRHAETEKAERTRIALTLWGAAQPFRGSPAEKYLRETRAIGDWLDTFALDDSRYHPSCPFDGQRVPALVALVRDIVNNTPIGIHRTGLRIVGNRVEKIERRSWGPVGGGAIKLSADAEVTGGLLVAEGIETTLSASKQLSFKPCWSLISTANLRTLPVLSCIECLTVAVDNDPAGIEAAEECVRRWLASGAEVITAQTRFHKDFNDVIIARQANA